MSAAISVSGLVKTFGPTRALDGLDLEVATGEVHGFLGPNGSGKSTTIRILLGLLHADAGQVRLLGGDPWRQAAELHRRLAYVPGDVNLWPNLTGGEVIDLLGRLRGGLDGSRRDALVERFDLDLSKRGRSYSKGNRQKVALVAALAADVDLLLLDEPTSGLDPIQRSMFQACVDEFRDSLTSQPPTWRSCWMAPWATPQKITSHRLGPSSPCWLSIPSRSRPSPRR
jgi:ABC-2 type transport system ATP-binding protein